MSWTTWIIDSHRKSNFFTSFCPTDACHILMATFWHEFFSLCGASVFSSKWWGPSSPHNKNKATNDCHLRDEILVWIDFFSMHTLRIAKQRTGLGEKDGKNVIWRKKIYHLPLVGIELGSCEFKSKSSNHWAVEANDEKWHITAQSILLHITILYK